MLEVVKTQIEGSIQVKQAMLEDPKLLELINEVAGVITEAYRNGKKTMLGGNGGSAADAQHIAGELVSRFYFDRPSLPGLALTTDTSILTAIGHDYGYEQVSSRRVQGLGQAGDLFVGISPSGPSPNTTPAFQAARAKG